MTNRFFTDRFEAFIVLGVTATCGVAIIQLVSALMLLNH